ncbi:MAG: hypothetical protein U0228_00580 [Myxococcaceae bacterium]
MFALTLLVLAAGIDAGDLPVEPVRGHFEVSLLGAGGLASVPAVGAGAGLHLEGGLVLGGSHVISARASFATAVVLFAMQFGASFAERVNDRLSLGAGLTWGGLFGVGDAAGAVTISLPLRITGTLGDDPRRGFTLGAEVAPGVVYAGGGYGIRPTLPGASMMVQLTAGWAWW